MSISSRYQLGGREAVAVRNEVDMRRGEASTRCGGIPAGGERRDA